MAPLAHLLKGFDVNPYIDFGSGKGGKTDLEDRRSVKVPVTITVLGVTVPLGSAQRFFEKLPRTGTNDNSIFLVLVKPKKPQLERVYNEDAF